MHGRSGRVRLSLQSGGGAAAAKRRLSEKLSAAICGAVTEYLSERRTPMKSKTIFYCKNCGNEFPRWQGQCPACGMWNTIEEHVQKPSAPGRSAAPVSGGRAAPKMLREVESGSEIRFRPVLASLTVYLAAAVCAALSCWWAARRASANPRFCFRSAPILENAADPVRLRRGKRAADQNARRPAGRGG